MQVTKGTWHMREQCVPGSLSSSPAREPGNEAKYNYVYIVYMLLSWCIFRRKVVWIANHAPFPIQPVWLLRLLYLVHTWLSLAGKLVIDIHLQYNHCKQHK